MELSQLREQAVADALEAGLRAGVESVIAYAVGLMRQAVGMGQGSAGPPVQCVGRHGAQLPLQGAELPLVTPPVQCVGSITPPVLQVLGNRGTLSPRT